MMDAIARRVRKGEPAPPGRTIGWMNGESPHAFVDIDRYDTVYELNSGYVPFNFAVRRIVKCKPDHMDCIYEPGLNACAYIRAGNAIGMQKLIRESGEPEMLYPETVYAKIQPELEIYVRNMIRAKFKDRITLYSDYLRRQNEIGETAASAIEAYFRSAGLLTERKIEIVGYSIPYGI